MEILIGVVSLVIAILLWLLPPEPLRRVLGLKDLNPDRPEQAIRPTPIPSFTGTAHNYYFQALNGNGASEFMEFIEGRVGKVVYLDLEVSAKQMKLLNQYVMEGNTKIYSLTVVHPTHNYWFEIKMIVEPSDDFFYGPISVSYGQLRGHFRIMGRYGIGTGVSGFELQAVSSQRE